MNSAIGVVDIVISKNNIPIRLTEERWMHIITAHPELGKIESSHILGAISDPDIILEGDSDELLAVKKTRKKMWFVVVYNEINRKDGFILTAYLTTDERWLFKRKALWNKIL